MKRKRTLDEDTIITTNKKKKSSNKLVNRAKQGHCRSCDQLFYSRTQLFKHLDINPDHMTEELGISDLMDGFSNQLFVE